jgi:CheY-like chemotaxis protein
MRINVLLADDNRADVVMLSEALRQAGLDYHLDVACNGQEAMSMLDQHGSDGSPALDLIILDLNLPRVSGFEILDILHSRPELRKTPTVVLTTSAWNDAATLLGKFDRQAFFEKPSLLRDWIATVRAIEAYRAERGLKSAIEAADHETDG